MLGNTLPLPIPKPPLRALGQFLERITEHAFWTESLGIWSKYIRVAVHGGKECDDGCFGGRAYWPPARVTGAREEEGMGSMLKPGAAAERRRDSRRMAVQ
jgi:hypothetical protein